jgi:hypothetical protein
MARVTRPGRHDLRALATRRRQHCDLPQFKLGNLASLSTAAPRSCGHSLVGLSYRLHDLSDRCSMLEHRSQALRGKRKVRAIESVAHLARQLVEGCHDDLARGTVSIARVAEGTLGGSRPASSAVPQ